MNNVELSRRVLEPASYDVIVERIGSHVPQGLVRDTEPAPGERRLNGNTCGKTALHRSGKNRYIGAGIDQALHLLPSDVADAVCPDLVGKTVQNSDALRVRFCVHMPFDKEKSFMRPCWQRNNTATPKKAAAEGPAFPSPGIRGATAQGP